jgi:protein-arginine kinase activator protein McsA
VPIYTYESVLSEAGIVLTEEESSATESSEAPTKGKSNKPLNEQLKDMPFDKLKALLEETLKKEDYEKAALVRDEMNRRN